MSLLGECGGNHRLDRSHEGVSMSVILKSRRSYTEDARIAGAIVAYGARIVDFEKDGQSWTLKIGRVLYTDKRVFSLECDGRQVRVGSGYLTEDEIERRVIGFVDGTVPVANILLDQYGKVKVEVSKGSPK